MLRKDGLYVATEETTGFVHGLKYLRRLQSRVIFRGPVSST